MACSNEHTVAKPESQIGQSPCKLLKWENLNNSVWRRRESLK